MCAFLAQARARKPMSKKILPSWLTHRYQLVIRNEANLAERAAIHFNGAKLIALAAIMLLIALGIGLLFSCSLLARWLNPSYLEQENKRKLLQLSAAVDSLDEQTAQQTKFIELIQCIIAGKEDPTYTLAVASSTPDATNEMMTSEPGYPSEALKEADVALRDEFEHPTSNWLAPHHQIEDDLKSLFFFRPVDGVITMPFNLKTGHYGVDIVARDKEPIKCIADGVVVFAACDVHMGWVIVVQHSQNLLSIYKHNATVLKKIGDLVRLGEVIAIMGNSGDLSTGPHLHFEIWYKGNAMNPEDLIKFCV